MAIGPLSWTVLQVRKSILLSALIAGLCLYPAGAARIQDELHEFNGYTLETPLSVYPSLKLIRSWSTDFMQEVGMYENPGEVVTVNGVSLTKGRYRFVNRQLESMHLTYEGRENRDKLMRWLEEHYGKLTSYERKMVNQIEWHGGRMAITLSYNFTTNQGALRFVSPDLSQLVDESIGSMPD